MSDQVTVQDNPEKSRFEAYQGEELVGYSEYERLDGLVAFTHTFVPEEYGGRGIAGELARVSLEDTREKGLTVRPVCPFYAKYLDKHPEYADLLDG